MKTQLLNVVCLLGLLFCVCATSPHAREVLAQSTGQGAVTWLENEFPITFNGNAQTISLLATANYIPAAWGGPGALPSGQQCNLNLRALRISCTTSGPLQFYSGSVVSGANYVGEFGVIANTPTDVPEWILRRGLKSGLGNPLYIVSPNGTLSLFGWIRPDPK